MGNVSISKEGSRFSYNIFYENPSIEEWIKEYKIEDTKAIYRVNMAHYLEWAHTTPEIQARSQGGTHNRQALIPSSHRIFGIVRSTVNESKMVKAAVGQIQCSDSEDLSGAPFQYLQQ